MNPRILLVEDDPTSRAFLQAATESLPAQVDVAASLAEAMALATTHEHALWLVDAHLPDGSGAGLLALLRARGLTTPAVAHTASREHEAHQTLRDAGFAATVTKPLPAQAWLASIRRALALEGDTAPARVRGVREPEPQAALPPWDDAQALSALAGNRESVAAMRGLFLAELAGVREAVAAAALAGDVQALRAQLHRLQASCGFVGAARLGAAATRLHQAPASQAALQDFHDAAQDTLSAA